MEAELESGSSRELNFIKTDFLTTTKLILKWFSLSRSAIQPWQGFYPQRKQKRLEMFLKFILRILSADIVSAIYDRT